MFRIKKNNKWQFVFTIDNLGGLIGWKKFIVGIIKIKTIPDQQGTITPNNYKGFLFSFNYWFPLCDIRFK